MSKRQSIIACLVFVFIFLAGIPRLWSIPAFSRKYKTSCATCHEAYPRLNAVGEAFRLNGYKFVDDETYIKDEPVVLGQEAYKKVWPEAIWPSDIPGLPPLSLRVISRYTVDLGGTKEARSTFETPYEVELLTAGALGDRISFFGEVEMEKEHGEFETDFEAWLQFEDLFGANAENAFNVRVGSLGMHEMGLFTARDHNRMTIDRYLYGNWRLPYPGGFATRNRFRLRNTQPGVEINGFGPRWRYAVGLVNGGEGDTEDNNSAKDIYFQLTFKGGGLGFDGSGGKIDTGAAAGSEGIYRDDSFTFGIFGYRGKALVQARAGAEEAEDLFWRIGPGAQVKYKKVRLGAGYLFGKNNEPYAGVSQASVDSNAYFLEVESFVYPWLVPSIRYEALGFDLPAVAKLQRDQDQRRIIASLSALIRANVRLVAEGRFGLVDERFTARGGQKTDDNQLRFRLDFSF